jgi:hypothetical protein
VIVTGTEIVIAATGVVGSKPSALAQLNARASWLGNAKERERDREIVTSIRIPEPIRATAVTETTVVTGTMVATGTTVVTAAPKCRRVIVTD